MRLKGPGHRILVNFRNNAVLLAGAVALLGAFSQSTLAACSEPSVWMDESTASSHVTAKREFVIVGDTPALARVQQVVLAMTVDRQGRICRAKAVAGPMEFRQRAEEVARNDWRYRPFLVDWKPVVVQFPITINFAVSSSSKTVELMAGAERLRQSLGWRPKLDQGPDEIA